MDQVIIPFNARLSTPLVPTVRGIYADRAGWFDGNATRLFPLRETDRANKLVAAIGRPLADVMRQQFKEGADFIKIYETGADSVQNGCLTTPYQYSEAQPHPR